MIIIKKYVYESNRYILYTQVSTYYTYNINGTNSTTLNAQSHHAETTKPETICVLK